VNPLLALTAMVAVVCPSLCELDAVQSEPDNQPGQELSVDEVRDAALSLIRETLEGLCSGVLNIVVHDGVVVQIDRTERRRVAHPRKSRQ
jgi:hypothetical protein